MHEQVSVLLTVIGPDRPGIVEAISGLVSENDASWVESRMARMASQFAGILRVTVPSQKADELMKSLGTLGTRGLRVHVERDDGVRPNDAPKTIHLDLLGNDRPGIVREISRVLAAHGVNIEELHTECVHAPMDGRELFKATATLSVPPELSLDKLRGTVEAIAGDLMVDVSFDEAPPKR